MICYFIFLTHFTFFMTFLFNSSVTCNTKIVIGQQPPSNRQLEKTHINGIGFVKTGSLELKSKTKTLFVNEILYRGIARLGKHYCVCWFEMNLISFILKRYLLFDLEKEQRYKNWIRVANRLGNRTKLSLFELKDEQSINAFAMMPSNVGLTSKLLKTSLPEDVRAAIIAHEYCHLSRKDTLSSSLKIISFLGKNSLSDSSL